MDNIFSARMIKASLIVGTLDILAASLQFYLKTNKGPAPIFKFIASGIFGKQAFAGGNIMMLYGIIFHYLIAYLFTAFFLLIADKLPQLLRFKIVAGIAYGAFIWIVMNLVVLPISNTPKSPLNLMSAIIGVMILIICIGIPLTFIASKRTAGRLNILS